MPKCNICRRNSTSPICNICMLSLQQLDEILVTYIEQSTIPEWIRDVMPEFDFMYNRDMGTRAFFNLAVELKDVALFEGKEYINIKDLTELRFTAVPTNTILHVMEKAYLIEKKQSRYKIGKLIHKLVSIRMAGYSLNSSELLKVHREILGVLCIAITKALIGEFKTYVPRGALAIFNMLSHHILEHLPNEEISNKINNQSQYVGYRIVPSRQRKHLTYYMAGFHDGSTRILDDLNDESEIICKPCITVYLNRMRERLRERDRERMR